MQLPNNNIPKFSVYKDPNKAQKKKFSSNVSRKNNKSVESYALLKNKRLEKQEIDVYRLYSANVTIKFSRAKSHVNMPETIETIKANDLEINKLTLDDADFKKTAHTQELKAEPTICITLPDNSVSKFEFLPLKKCRFSELKQSYMSSTQNSTEAHSNSITSYFKNQSKAHLHKAKKMKK